VGVRSTGRLDPRRPDDEWHADRLLIGPLLVEQPVFAPQEAVVGGEHEHRVAELAARGDLAVDGGDRTIHGLERVELATPNGLQRALLAERELRVAVGLVADVRLVERTPVVVGEDGRTAGGRGRRTTPEGAARWARSTGSTALEPRR